ncbi:ABC transporter permease [Salibacter halophilus]|uniref:FtsX-like permease family protein n=1 Tax=Salibacter halophilus TaxID=1803916 RepID=A0A6N6M803_9FLAO|nr:FtsX-like permease family protein [Salibacter halophilus]KAB1063212.1 FtsX-like permease family protein [Salibacter halophilus]
MKLPLHIARRYLFGKKKHNVINLISGISMLGVGIGAMALVIVLSAFNGLEDLVESLYSTFDPDIKITAKKGKTFHQDSINYGQILNINGVQNGSRVLEETALLKNADFQAFAKLKGVDTSFVSMSNLNDAIVYGSDLLYSKKGTPNMVMGYILMQNLHVQVEGFPRPLNVYAANRKAKSVGIGNTNAFKIKQISPTGVFSINADFDSEYALAPLPFAQNLLNYENRVSAIELRADEGENLNQLKSEIEQLVGSDYEVETRFQLNDILYKTNNTEKWVTFMILSFILVIATFNIIGSLTMLIIDKEDDILILKSMGADTSLMQKIFFTEGFLISVIGGGAGILLGLIVSFLQMQFGLLKVQGMLVDAYPIKIELLDVLAIMGIVGIIGAISAYIPTRILINRYAKAGSSEE